ncbi:DUF721 domain-containing protein [Achromobacter insuavis]
MRGAGVLATARKHLQIQYAVAAILPAPLPVCQVGKLENQRLQLVVPSAAHAAKMRQLAPRIAQALADQGWNLNEIAVKVQAGLPKPGARKPLPPKEAQPLGTTALGAFETLHDNLRPGPLADAVAKLLKHHKGS